jgi:hypothetical protein
MKPKTIYEIYEELLAWRIGSTCFRVRDIETNKDYLIYREGQWHWDRDHMPQKVIGLLLEDGFGAIYSLDCDEKIWALLSSRKEIEYFRVISSDTAADLIKINYMD